MTQLRGKQLSLFPECYAAPAELNDEQLQELVIQERSRLVAQFAEAYSRMVAISAEEYCQIMSSALNGQGGN